MTEDSIHEECVFEDCKGCNWHTKLTTRLGTYKGCDKGVIRFSNRRCQEREIPVTMNELDRIDRRLKKGEEELERDNIGRR